MVRVRSGRHERSYDKENYIDFRMRLLGDAEHQGPTVLSPGIHSFPFKLGLPIDLPSTFLGRYGWVQYYCKAALREPSGLIHKNHQVFIVMNPIDLNTEQPYLAVRDLFTICRFRFCKTVLVARYYRVSLILQTKMTNCNFNKSKNTNFHLFNYRRIHSNVISSIIWGLPALEAVS